jgi:hypothetical protein
MGLKKHPFTFDNEIILPRTNTCILKVGMCSKAKPGRRVITGEMGRGLLNRYRKTRTLGSLKQTNVRTFSSWYSPISERKSLCWNAPRLRPFDLLLRVAALVGWYWLQEVDILGENQSQYHFPHNELHVYWPGLEPGSLWWKAED